ncbi:MAG: NAD(P)H-dependent oxidoreductase subunit E [Acidimicrobiia bacterium]|nr:NAD(P)H-dependent oxidoreductase subunit E [Acidimicrobiia bacterium]
MAFTAPNRARAREIVERYPFKRSAVLPLLHLAQDQDGWVTPEAMEEVGELVGISAAQVLGVCSFYTMFKREQVGGLVVSVCTNVTCLVRGGPELYEALRARYASDDDVFVEEVECLAACDTAPVMQVNYDYHSRMTPETAEAVIEEYKSGKRTRRGISGGRITIAGSDR